ncbi:recombination regulator RecX [Streptomyces sp. NPDC005876]|uniref:recombination regulator RecX n=1 Tax=Streptomyces sp. NPDC005876 TaxID=3157076 RepID=UPI0033DD7B3A
MTRRTDWAEYAAPDPAARRRRRGGPDDEGSAGAGGDGYGGDLTGTDGGTGPGCDPSVPYGTETPYGTGTGYGAYADETGETDGEGEYGSGARRGDARPRGADGTRGRRRRGRPERGGPSGTDGGAASSSRAERAEPPRDPVEQARAICLRLLTGTPRTRKQLADALRKREIPDDAAEEVLSRFEEVGLINDSAFADAWVESRHHGRGLARRALARELRTKGVDSTLIDAAVSQLDSEQEEATARELVDRKLRSTRGLDRDKRLRRLAGMLARKGYAEGMALRVVRQALEEEGEDTEFLDDEAF